MTEDIFVMSNVRIFNKEIEKKKMEDVNTLLYLRSAELSQVFGFKEPMLFQNICSDASRVQDCWKLAKTRVRAKKCPAPKYGIFK